MGYEMGANRIKKEQGRRKERGEGEGMSFLSLLFSPLITVREDHPLDRLVVCGLTSVESRLCRGRHPFRRYPLLHSARCLQFTMGVTSSQGRSAWAKF